MNIQSYIRNVSRKLLMVLVVSLALFACDDTIYDYEGDCSVTYRVKFCYDYNMKFADAFAHEVKTVTLYMLDDSGNIVWQRTESGDTLASKDYAMIVDIDPGKYDLMVWCGTADKGSFYIPNAKNGRDLTCTLNREHTESGEAYIDKDIDRLFHGYLPDQVFPEKEGVYTYVVPLVKNTNNFRVVLQHLSGLPVDKDKFTFIITDDNGSMDWNNSLLPDEIITYYAWHTASGSAGVTDIDGTSHAYSAAIAEFTVPRLVKESVTRGEPVQPRLTVLRSDNGSVVLSIPLIDYALLVKGFYNQDMDDQEYLDRQDEWNMIFFIDEGYRWINAYIYINSWKVVLQNTDL